MSSASADLSRKVGELSDVELALLLSIVANEHCLIQTEPEALNLLGQELELVRLKINGPRTRTFAEPSPSLSLFCLFTSYGIENNFRKLDEKQQARSAYTGVSCPEGSGAPSAEIKWFLYIGVCILSSHDFTGHLWAHHAVRS
ncbi:MAG: hypothetical protein Q9184_000922 [Pyrenodesmia sp. 2 TL-2023]